MLISFFSLSQLPRVSGRVLTHHTMLSTSFKDLLSLGFSRHAIRFVEPPCQRRAARAARQHDALRAGGTCCFGSTTPCRAIVDRRPARCARSRANTWKHVLDRACSRRPAAETTGLSPVMIIGGRPCRDTRRSANEMSFLSLPSSTSAGRPESRIFAEKRASTPTRWRLRARPSSRA